MWNQEKEFRRDDLMAQGEKGAWNEELDQLNKDKAATKSDGYLFEKVEKYGPGCQAWHELIRRGKI